MSREEAGQIVTDFFEARGGFSVSPPEGMSASSYPRTLARFLENLDQEAQAEIVGVLLDFAITGGHTFSHAAAYVSSDLAIRGMTAAFMPHVPRIREWFENRRERRWWTSGEAGEEAIDEARSAIQLMNVLWCCDASAAGELTDMILQQTSNERLRSSLARSKLLLE